MKKEPRYTFDEKDRLVEVNEEKTEVCECGGIAEFAYWDKGDKRIPILKCKKCGDKFEASEDYWRE